ncbi:putative ribonuclease H-like domain-containing protein [Tanacetum coccineum]
MRLSAQLLDIGFSPFHSLPIGQLEKDAYSSGSRNSSWLNHFDTLLFGCHDGGGNGLTKTSLITHLRDRHCSGDSQIITKQSLTTSLAVFEEAEVTFKCMGLWLCGVCFKTHTFLSKCRHGKGSDFVSPPDYGDNEVSTAGTKVYAARLQLLEELLLAFALRNFDLEVMEFESAHSNTTAKLPILKLGDYEMWVIRIKQYFQVQDYALWEVIEYGNSWVSVPQTAQENGTSVTKMSVPVTAEEKTNKKNDVKARSLLLMALPNEHQLTFSQYNDAKTMFVAIETRFRGNEGTKKTQKTLLKQQYENFSASSTESLDSIFNMLQKIVSRLAILGVVITQEDLNSKFLSSLPPEWNTHVVVWMNKAEIETMSIDDLYNNFKIIEQSVKKSVGASSGAQNLAFMTAPSTSSTNDVNTAKPAYEVSTVSPNVNTASPQDLEQIHEDDLEAMDLKWHLSLLSMREKRYFQRTGKKIFINVNDTVGYDKSKFRNQDNTRKHGNNEDTSSNVMLAIDGVGFDWSDMAEEQGKPLMDDKGFVDSGCLRHMTGNIAYLSDFKKFDGVNTAHPKSIVFSAKPMLRFSKTAQSTAQAVNTTRPKAVKTARPNSAVVNVVRVNQENAGKPQQDDTGFVDSGCSRHMTGNIAYLLDFKEFDRGYVTFGGGAHGGRISSKGTLKTDSLDFEDVYFVNELKFNLFSVSQMCDKKNYVLFTDTECLVLSPNFKLPDESQILLKIPRKDNMYSFDMKNIVPKESLTCLVAKATLDESMLWHRRLGHINFKNINKLVKDNLVRGLPTKRFENDQTCVACLKGKQHRASCKSKVLNPITKPLFMLHMDLFGPTFVSSLMHKKYCLVVTDDYSRFTWVFFLTTKDETSEILKNFIKEIENLVDKKVKIIRCDNGTEFKNKVMDDFCREKGIRREYSVARTPQQNGVAERRNRTLIEAARTMLADSKLPTTFWAEAVSTACYVHNRVLVVKPHNKTPYELFRGFKLALSFMRLFGCYVTILNTLDSLGKFDGKVMKNKPMIDGNCPKWLFDIDSLTQSMNYVPVAAGTITNEYAENGNSWVSVPQTAQENGTSVMKMYVPITVKEKTNRKNDVKARSLLLMALPNEHQLTFSQYPDAKTMLASIETRFGGNEVTKKTQKTLLKQQYENFSASSTESLDSIFNRL